jgi:dimethylhistidine N-methyltransferase
MNHHAITALHEPIDRPGLDAFAESVRHGLGLPRKRLDCKYFYDERGAGLFERICEQPEYYPTRTEIGILERNGHAMARALGQRVALIEPGSGAGIKTRLLLDRLSRPAAYVPVDIAREQLAATAGVIATDYPGLPVQPVFADFTRGFDIPRLPPRARRVVYFPGSTIGNFDPFEAAGFLAHVREVAGPGGGLLIGVDLVKDPAILHAAYNDAAGVTAEFNLNLLHRINRELQGTLDPDRFAHYAFYQPARRRIEMHLVSRVHHTARAAGRPFAFRAGESIHTENSHKYDRGRFVDLARGSGLRLRRAWTDPKEWFSVLLFEIA